MPPKLIVEVVGDTSKLNKSLKQTETRLQKFGRNVDAAASGKRGGLGSSAALLRGGGIAVGLGIASKVALDATNKASDLNEQIAKSRQVFGNSSRAIEDWSKTTATSMGLSRREALTATGTFGNLFATVKIGPAAAGEMSKSLVKLAGDLASFNNADPSEVLDALRSGLIGEAEPLRRFGVLLSETRVQQQAMADTGKTNAKELTNQEKAFARYKIILQDTSKAQGDYARTAGGLANQQRTLAAQVDDLQVKLGELLVPALENVVTQLNFGITAAQQFGAALGAIKLPDFLGGGSGSGLAANISGLALTPGLAPIILSKAVLDKLGLTGGAGGAVTPGQLAAALGVPIGSLGFDPRLVTSGAAPGAFGATAGPQTQFKFGGAKPTPAVTGLSTALQLRELDARIGGNRNTLKGVLAEEATVLRGLLKDITLKPAEKVTIKEALLGVTEEIRGIDAAIISDADAKAAAAKSVADALKAKQKSNAAKLAAAAKAAAAAVAKANKDIADALTKQASDIKSAVLDALDTQHEKITNKRALTDALKDLRLAKLLGGSADIEQANRAVADARFAILRQGVEDAPVTLAGTERGRGTILGVAGITININGAENPDAIARTVINILNRSRKHGVNQLSGSSPNHNTMT